MHYISLVCSTSSTALAAARSIFIQLRFAALYLMRYRLFQQTLSKDLQASGEDQISLTDPDSRSVVLLRNIINVGYNIQAASDAKHKLLVEYDTGLYPVSDFTYDPENDLYVCPQGNPLRTNGTWHHHSDSR